MKALIDLKDIKKYKTIPCECTICKKTFIISKSLARRVLKGTKKADCCSKKCSGKYHFLNRGINGKKELAIEKRESCKKCHKPFVYKSKKIRLFCSRKCSAQFNGNNDIHLNPSFSSWIKSSMKDKKRDYEKMRLKDLDLYSLNPSLCKVCNKPKVYDRRFKKVCSKECLSIRRRQVALI